MPARAMTYQHPRLSPDFEELITRATRGAQHLSAEDGQLCREIAARCEERDQLREERRRRGDRPRRTLKH